MNDQPMTRDELSAAFAQLTDPEWPATIPTYREKQHKRYREAMAQGNRESAQDALWRAASEADMLAPREHSHTELTPARITELLTALGWTP